MFFFLQYISLFHEPLMTREQEKVLPSTAMRSLSSCCRRLCLSSSSSSRALQTDHTDEHRAIQHYYRLQGRHNKILILQHGKGKNTQ